MLTGPSKVEQTAGSPGRGSRPRGIARDMDEDEEEKVNTMKFFSRRTAVSVFSFPEVITCK